jgi:PAS domain S-box-containing protein
VTEDVSPPAELVAELLEKLVRFDDLADACSAVLDRVAGNEYRRAFVLINVGGELRGAAWGLPAHALQGVIDEAEEPGSLLRAALARGGAPRLLPAGALAADFDGYAVVPFAGSAAGRAGLLVLEATALDERVERIARVFSRCGPSLERVAEIEQVRASEARSTRRLDLMKRIVNALFDPVLLTNAVNEVVLANRRADELLTPGEEDSEGRRRALQINNLLLSSFLTQSVITERGGASRELNLVDTVDGSDLLFEVLSVPFGDGGVISVLRDITDLKRAVGELESQYSRSRVAEHDARQERDRLNAILENVGDPILVTDAHSNIILMNPEAERLFVADDGGRTSPRYRVQANDTKFTTLISNFLLRPEQRQAEMLTVLDPETGAELPVEVVSTKVLNSRGEPTAIVSVVHDLTQVEENRRLAGELRTLNDQLEDRIHRATLELAERNRQLEWQSAELQKASKLKSEFLANMSHELRTPINVILGYTSLMRERIYGELTKQQDEALSKVYHTSQHLLELINDILDLSKIEAGKMPVHIESVAVEELVAELGETIAPMIHEKQLEYRTDLSVHLPVIETDRTKLRQVLLNLLSNAIKFTQVGSVTVRGEPSVLDGRPAVRVEVVDTGIGIKPEHIHAIFDDFRQIDQSHTREYGGTGLGLSITRKLLELVGGRIEVSSVFGEGTTFAILLPSVAADLAADATFASAVTRPSS